MATVALTGADTIKINGRILADLGDGDVAALTYPNDLMTVKTGKNGNSLYGFNESGKQCELVIRIVRGSSDDKFMNQQLAIMKNDPAAYPLLTGELTKRIGNGLGAVLNDTYILSGGVINKEVEVKSNVEGDTEQSQSIYHLKFTNAPRVIG